MGKFITGVFAPLLLVAGALPSVAAVVYEQPLASSPTLYTSQNDTAIGGFGAFAKVYDNFSLTATTSITDVHWYGGFFGSGSLPAPTISSFLIQFWADSSGQPGSSAILSQTITGNASQATTGVTSFGDPVYYYEVDLLTAFVAQAGTTYWLSVTPSTGFPPSWGWATGTGGDGDSYQDFSGSRTPLGVDFAFSLTSTPSNVPEPGSLLLAGLALAGLAIAGRARKPG